MSSFIEQFSSVVTQGKKVLKQLKKKKLSSEEELEAIEKALYTEMHLPEKNHPKML
jgi:hypothetical protein